MPRIDSGSSGGVATGGSGVPAAHLKQNGAADLGLFIGLEHAEAGPDWLLDTNARRTAYTPPTASFSGNDQNQNNGDGITITLPNTLALPSVGNQWDFNASRGAALAVSVNVARREINAEVPAAGATLAQLAAAIAAATFPIRAGLPNAGTQTTIGAGNVTQQGSSGAGTLFTIQNQVTRTVSFRNGVDAEPIHATIDAANKTIDIFYDNADTLEQIRDALNDFELAEARLLATEIGGTNLAASPVGNGGANVPFDRFYSDGVLPRATHEDIQAGVKAYARTGGPEVPPSELPIDSIQVGIETAAGVLEGAESSWKSITGEYDVVVHTTNSAPRIRLNLPPGKNLGAVYDNGVDVTGLFTVDGVNGQVYHSNQDFQNNARLLVVVTS